MASSQPIVRQINWFSIIPQILVFVIISSIYYFWGIQDFILFGAATYLTLSLTLRKIIPKSHRKGIVFFKKREYEKAICEFEKSYEFFKRNEWIDKYRFLVLLSSSRASYIEMALLNIAFCYGQIGEGAKSKDYYESTLREFPGSQMAIVSLRMFDSFSDIKNDNNKEEK
jgi:tetratricopeptide (TPR) repeat protein